MHRIVAVLCLAALLGWTAQDVAASPETESTGKPFRNWKHLQLKARAIPLFSGRVDMFVSEHGDAIEFRTETIARFLGARLASDESISVIDAATGRTRSFLSLSKKRARRYLFEEKRYTVEKLEPRDDPDAPLSEWESRKKETFDYPVDEDGETIPVNDYYGMLYGLRDLPLDGVGSEAVVWIATSDGPQPFRIEVIESRTSEWNYRNPALGARMSVPVQEWRLNIAPADPDSEAEGFLDMKGETALWVEAKTRTLLSLEGRIPKVPGKVRLVLTEME